MPDYPDDLMLTEDQWAVLEAWDEFLAFSELMEDGDAQP